VPLQYGRERGCVIVSFEGSYRMDEALEAIAAALGEPGEPAEGLLLDLSDSESFRARSTDGLRQVAEFLATRRECFSSRLATVGTSDLAYGLLRIGEVFASDRGIMVQAFRTRDEALAWLEGVRPA
jgi:hypothetical protein